MPKRYESVETRKFVWLSLRTDSMVEAKVKEGTAWEQLVAGWEAKLAGDTSDAEQRFEAARELAEARGFRFMRVDKVAKLPTDELLERVEAVPVRKGQPDWSWSWSSPGFVDTFSLMKESVFHAQNEEPVPHGI